MDYKVECVQRLVLKLLKESVSLPSTIKIRPDAIPSIPQLDVVWKELAKHKDFKSLIIERTNNPRRLLVYINPAHLSDVFVRIISDNKVFGEIEGIEKLMLDCVATIKVKSLNLDNVDGIEIAPTKKRHIFIVACNGQRPRSCPVFVSKDNTVSVVVHAKDESSVRDLIEQAIDKLLKHGIIEI